MTISFVGLGTISRLIRRELSQDGEAHIEFWGFFDPYVGDSPEDHDGLHRAASISELLDSPTDLVVEASSQEGAQAYVPEVLRGGKSALSMSVGAYLDDEFYAQIEAICREPGSGKLYIPSGALPAVDMIQAASLRSIDSVELITRKPFGALAGSPLFEEKVKDATEGEAVTVFSGNAREAVKLFPKNVNISATLSLAGIGAEKTRVTIIADPSVDKNMHTVKVTGAFGELTAEVKSNPSPNPKTSLTAPLSAVSLIKRLSGGIQIGS
jgi:aspartate dehydrogenase